MEQTDFGSGGGGGQSTGCVGNISEINVGLGL